MCNSCIQELHIDILDHSRSDFNLTLKIIIEKFKLTLLFRALILDHPSRWSFPTFSVTVGTLSLFAIFLHPACVLSVGSSDIRLQLQTCVKTRRESRHLIKAEIRHHLRLDAKCEAIPVAVEYRNRN